MITHYPISLRPLPRGFHLITDEILSALPALPEQGILQLFCQHTSAGITINENADPTVRLDFEDFFNRIVPEGMDFVRHSYEGSDDMPAHVKASLVGFSLQIPIVNGHLALGTWQGIYLAEFRNHPSRRKLIATLIS